MTHTRQRTDITPPPPERLIPSLNSSIGEGGWALWRPLKTDTDRNTGRGPPERNRQFGGHGGAGSSGGHGGAGSSGGHGGAGSSGGHGRWSSGPWPRSSRPGPYSRNSYTPQKISLGKLGGIRSPPGLNTQHDSTKHDRNALQGQTDRTGQPTGTRSPPGLAWRLRLPPGMTRSQRPSQGPSATASISTTGGQAARMAGPAELPRHPAVG